MWTGLIIIGVLFSCVLCLNLYIRSLHRGGSMIWTAIPLILALFLLSTNFLEYSVISSVAKIDAQGNVIPDQDVVLCSTSTDCVNYDDNYGQPFSIRSHVSPITDNPKVRTVSYRIFYKVNDFGKLLKKTIHSDCYLDEAGKENRIVSTRSTIFCVDNLLDYHLYEFNNNHSKELSGFYNPLSADQKAAFFSLINENLGSKYAPLGVEITGVEWAVD